MGFTCPICRGDFGREQDGLLEHYKEDHEHMYGPIVNVVAQDMQKMVDRFEKLKKEAKQC